MQLNNTFSQGENIILWESGGFTHSVILGSMLPIHKRFPSWATLSEMMEAFSTVPAADDMSALQEVDVKDESGWSWWDDFQHSGSADTNTVSLYTSVLWMRKH